MNKKRAWIARALAAVLVAATLTAVHSATAPTPAADGARPPRSGNPGL